MVWISQNPAKNRVKPLFFAGSQLILREVTFWDSIQAQPTSDAPIPEVAGFRIAQADPSSVSAVGGFQSVEKHHLTDMFFLKLMSSKGMSFGFVFFSSTRNIMFYWKNITTSAYLNTESMHSEESSQNEPDSVQLSSCAYCNVFYFLPGCFMGWATHNLLLVYGF